MEEEFVRAKRLVEEGKMRIKFLDYEGAAENFRRAYKVISELRSKLKESGEENSELRRKLAEMEEELQFLFEGSCVEPEI